MDIRAEFFGGNVSSQKLQPTNRFLGDEIYPIGGVLSIHSQIPINHVMQTFADCWVWRSIYPYKLPRPDVQLLNARAVLGHFFNSVGFHRDFCESYDCGVRTTTFGTFS